MCFSDLPNGYPHYLETVDYWNLPGAFEKFQRDHSSLYWDRPFDYDGNPYEPSNNWAMALRNVRMAYPNRK